MSSTTCAKVDAMGKNGKAGNLNLKVLVDAQTKAALEQLAEVNERSVGAEIRLAIRQHLKGAK